jgi:hypothetical protein
MILAIGARYVAYAGGESRIRWNGLPTLLVASEEAAELAADAAGKLVEQFRRIDPEAGQEVGVLFVIDLVGELLLGACGVVVSPLALEEVDDRVLVDLHRFSWVSGVVAGREGSLRSHRRKRTGRATRAHVGSENTSPLARRCEVRS